MLALFANLPCSARIFVVSAGVATAAFGFGYGKGRADGKTATEAAALRKASDRIAAMEKNNADFNTVSPRDRCLELMRDSGLPDAECD